MNRGIALFLAGWLMGAALGLAQDAKAEGPPARGKILCERWVAVPGDALADLLKHPAFPAQPSQSELLDSFEIAPTDQDSFGSAVRGYVYPPATGEYVFWLACDDAGALSLSLSEDPTKKQKIAEVSPWTGPRQWDAMASQKSKAIILTAGKRYYIETNHKAGGAPNHLAVGWRLPDGTMERPIPGSRLSPAAIPRIVPTTVTLDPKLKLPQTPGHHKMPEGALVQGPGAAFKMSYLLYLPRDYDKTQDRKPLFIFLHGNTHQGTDLEGLLNEGPAMDLRDNKALRDWFPFIGLFPQCPPNTRWDTYGFAAATVALIDEISRKYRVDPDRVYLSGLSMGGKGTWLTSLEGPDRFAAIAPISAIAVQPDRADRLRNIATWIICGSNDGEYTEGSKVMTRALKQAGAEVELTVFPNEGHGVWGRYYPDPKFYERLLAHKRQTKGPTTQP